MCIPCKLKLSIEPAFLSFYSVSILASARYFLHFYCGKPGHFQKNYRHFRRDKGGADGAEPKKISEKRGTSAIATSEEELMLIIEESDLNLDSDESTWVVNSEASYHLTPDRKCFSSYKAGDHGSVKMGNEGACRKVSIGDVCSEMFDTFQKLDSI